MPRPRVLAIVGPTAGGKSTVALALAQAHQGEIVNCDSVQVYRDFEIGCAKPDAAERARVAHHLLDVVSWCDPFDAQRYRSLALAALTDIRGRSRMPVVCGGTGLYLRCLRFGLMDAPPADESLRQQLYADEAKQPGTLFARLQTLDPLTASTVDKNNLVRVVRAVEVTLLTGSPISKLREQHGFAREQVPMRVVALDWPMSTLRARISERVDAMLTRGLLDEVSGLLARGVSPMSRPMRAVGYAEASEVVLGHAPRAGLEERVVRATVAYARRQRTWFRREPEVHWVSVTSTDQAIADVGALHFSMQS